MLWGVIRLEVMYKKIWIRQHISPILLLDRTQKGSTLTVASVRPNRSLVATQEHYNSCVGLF